MISITVIYAAAQKQIEIPLTIEENAIVELAIKRSRILEQFPEIKLSGIAVGIFGKRVKLDSALQAGDRIEIYRPLTIDPKEARRLRANRK